MTKLKFRFEQTLGALLLIGTLVSPFYAYSQPVPDVDEERPSDGSEPPPGDTPTEFNNAIPGAFDTEANLLGAIDEHDDGHFSSFNLPGSGSTTLDPRNTKLGQHLKNTSQASKFVNFSSSSALIDALSGKGAGADSLDKLITSSLDEDLVQTNVSWNLTESNLAHAIFNSAALSQEQKNGRFLQFLAIAEQFRSQPATYVVNMKRLVDCMAKLTAEAKDDAGWSQALAACMADGAAAANVGWKTNPGYSGNATNDSKMSLWDQIFDERIKTTTGEEKVAYQTLKAKLVEMLPNLVYTITNQVKDGKSLGVITLTQDKNLPSNTDASLVDPKYFRKQVERVYNAIFKLTSQYCEWKIRKGEDGKDYGAGAKYGEGDSIEQVTWDFSNAKLGYKTDFWAKDDKERDKLLMSVGLEGAPFNHAWVNMVYTYWTRNTSNTNLPRCQELNPYNDPISMPDEAAHSGSNLFRYPYSFFTKKEALPAIKVEQNFVNAIARKIAWGQTLNVLRRCIQFLQLIRPPGQDKDDLLDRAIDLIKEAAGGDQEVQAAYDQNLREYTDFMNKMGQEVDRNTGKNGANLLQTGNKENAQPEQ